MESFVEEVQTNGFQVVAKQIAEAEVLLVAKILTAFEQQPTGHSFPESYFSNT